MCPSLIEIGSKTAEKNSAQTNRQTDRHYEYNGHLAVNQNYVTVTLCITGAVPVELRRLGYYSLELFSSTRDTRNYTGSSYKDYNSVTFPRLSHTYRSLHTSPLAATYVYIQLVSTSLPVWSGLNSFHIGNLSTKRDRSTFFVFFWGGGRTFIKRFAVCYRTIVCPVLSSLSACLSVT